MAFLFRRLFADPDVAIDLGTANTRLYAHGRGLVADEPSMVKVNSEKKFVEVGRQCVPYLTSVDPKVRPLQPLRAGVIEHDVGAISLLSTLLQRTHQVGRSRPRVLVCIPTDASERERRSLAGATRCAGASAVKIIPEPLAAAVGSGLDLSSPYAQMLVDVGEGVTDIAVFRSGELVQSFAVRVACSDIKHAIHDFVRTRYSVDLPPPEVDRLAQTIGISLAQVPVLSMTAIGTDPATWEKVKVFIKSKDIFPVVEPVVRHITGTIRTAFRELPNSMACEVIETGICLTGGGATYQGLANRIAREMSLSVAPASNPLYAVINGAQKILESRMEAGLWEGVG